MSAKTLTHSRHCCILLLSSHISKKNQCPLHLLLLDEALIATSVMPRENPTGTMYWMFFSLFCNYDLSSHTHTHLYFYLFIPLFSTAHLFYILPPSSLRSPMWSTIHSRRFLWISASVDGLLTDILSLLWLT